MGLREAIRYVAGSVIQECPFLTDSSILVKVSAQEQPPMDTDWSTFSEVLDVWRLFRTNVLYTCSHVSRSQNTLADYLAKKGRTEEWSYTFPIFRQ